MSKSFLQLLIGLVLIFGAFWAKKKPSPQPIPSPVPQPQPEPEPQPQPTPKPPEYTFKTLDWPKVWNKVSEDTFYADIINHAKNPVLKYNRSTNAHESTHMINSDIRNSIPQISDGFTNMINAFYIGNGKYVKCTEPPILKEDVISYVPPELRFNRYKLYIIGQREWNDRPLYILDEFVSYINGGKVSVENVLLNKNDTGWTDGVSGCLEFSIYTISLCMAINDKSNYWKENAEFRSFISYLLDSACETYNKGKDMEEFKWDKQDKLLESFKDENNKKMKDFMAEYSVGLNWLK